ncbi:hypothetical protein [Prauserella rugosa]|uniref:Uncharacterized protein n=1 Tax=Prauserella rugosa TaxID=43354 RepID=A0A660C612_9PSEU|nr:hypothetical protein [Prauserella rugosa]TWH19040.1 hypothetical protein JD82_00862 [Prauserella rugosa]
MTSSPVEVLSSASSPETTWERTHAVLRQQPGFLDRDAGIDADVANYVDLSG